MLREQDNSVKKPNAFRLAYWEFLLAIRSGAVQITLALFLLLMTTAMLLGVVRTQARQGQADVNEAENRLVEMVFRDVLLGKQESPDVNAEDSTEDSTRQSRLEDQLRLSAKSPYLVSHATNLWSVSLVPSPLSALSVGECDKWPDQYPVHGVSLAKTIQRTDRVRPSSNAYGPFDATFVVMAIAPLVVIGLTFNVSSRDRETGLQSLMVAQTPSLGKLMAVRCFVRAVLVILLVASSANGILLFGFASQFDSNVIVNLAIWNVAATCYLLTWASVSLFVNSFSMSSSANGAALLLLWLILVLLIPRFVSNAVQVSVKTLPENKLAELEKDVRDVAAQDLDGLVKGFQAENPDVDLDLDDEQQMAFAGYLLAHDAVGRQAEEIVARYYAPQLSRAKHLEMSSWLSPAISFRIQSDQCSGNSELSFVAFSAHAASVQADVLEAFLVPSIKNQECTVETIESMPAFQELSISKETQLSKSFLFISALLVWAAVFAGIGMRRLGAKDPKKAGTSLSETGDGENA